MERRGGLSGLMVLGLGRDISHIYYYSTTATFSTEIRKLRSGAPVACLFSV